MQATKQTGVVHPRDYGILLPARGDRLFVSPMRYALGALQLQDEVAMGRMMDEYERTHGIEEGRAVHALREAIRERYNATSLLDEGGRDALRKVHWLGDTLVGTVGAKSGGAPHVAKLRIQHGAIVRTRCPCPDDEWSEPKHLDLLCSHEAALHLAIVKDKRSRLGSRANITALTEKNLAYAPPLPFALNRAKTAELVYSFFVGGMRAFEVSRRALEDSTMYTSSMKSALETGVAQYGVVAQRRQKLERTGLSATQERFYSAVNALETRIDQQLRDELFRFHGYSVVFKGSPFETIAKRYVRANTVYEIATRVGEAPLLVRKNLHGDPLPWIASADLRDEMPAKRAPYLSIDDCTRKHALTEVLVPAKHYETFVPGVLRDFYEANMR